MATINVVVTGASGKMSREVLAALVNDPGTEPVGAVSQSATEEYLALPDGDRIPLSKDLEALLARVKPDVMVDFTSAAYAVPAARQAIAAGVRPVIGTSGLAPRDVEELQALCVTAKLGGVIAANFALGAVVMIHLAEVAARFFDYAEIIEMHHESKADAPSGTAIATARAMAQARGREFVTAPTLKETLPHPRGSVVEGIPVHSLRLPGLMAHQEIVLGSQGQTLRIRHDALNRECYMPGVLMAVKEVMHRAEMVVGLDKLLGL